MRAANTAAALVILLWLWLALLGRKGLARFPVDDVPDWPTLTSVDFRVVLPMSVAAALLVFAWVCNAFGARPFGAGDCINCVSRRHTPLSDDQRRRRRLTSVSPVADFPPRSVFDPQRKLGDGTGLLTLPRSSRSKALELRLQGMVAPTGPFV
jgi:hypothetical protein